MSHSETKFDGSIGDIWARWLIPLTHTHSLEHCKVGDGIKMVLKRMLGCRSPTRSTSPNVVLQGYKLLPCLAGQQQPSTGSWLLDPPYLPPLPEQGPSLHPIPYKPTCKQSLASGNPRLSDSPLFWSRLRISGLTALMSIFRLAVGVHGSPWQTSLGLVGVVKGPKSGWISANTTLAFEDSCRGLFINPLLCGSEKRFSWFGRK